MDWRTAYLEQAKSDYAMLLKLNQEEAPLCHRLHYLQMTTEKMAKGFLTPKGGARYPKTHNALVVNFVKLAEKRPDCSPGLASFTSGKSIRGLYRKPSRHRAENRRPFARWQGPS